MQLSCFFVCTCFIDLQLHCFWQLSKVPDTKRKLKWCGWQWAIYATTPLKLNELERRTKLSIPVLCYWMGLCDSCLIPKCPCHTSFTYLSPARVLIIWRVLMKKRTYKKNPHKPAVCPPNKQRPQSSPALQSPSKRGVANFRLTSALITN